MVDIPTIVAGIGAVKAGVDALLALKQLKGSAPESLEARAVVNKLKSDILDLEAKVLEMRSDLYAHKQQAQTDKELIDKLQRENQVLLTKPKEPDWKSKLVFNSDGIVLSEPIQGYPPGPFCTTCYTVTDKLVALTELPRPFQHAMGQKWHCIQCDAKFEKKPHR